MKNSRRISCLAIVAAVIFLSGLYPEFLGGQSVNGVILGRVTDPSGGVLPGVTVVVENTDTGVSQSTVTNDMGNYRVPSLPPGNYRVRAELSGFSTAVREGVALSVQQQAVVNFTLQLGEISEEVVVTGGAEIVETTTSTVSGLVNEREILDLPLNGRDYSQLALLQIGVVQTTSSGPDPFTVGGRTGKFVVNGARPTANSFLLDGTEINDPDFNVPVGGVAGFLLGVEAIREFRVLTDSYSAEFGRNAGALVTAVTRSGTNEFHGSVFEFHRNSGLDAKNFFDDPEGGVPSFRRNNFGFALGGPIVKDKTFFFTNAEFFKEVLGVTSVATVPDEKARMGILPILNPETGQREDVNIGVAPGVQPFLDLFPLPNGMNFGNGTAEFRGSAGQPADEEFWVTRIDHHFTDKDLLYGRYTYDDSDSERPFASTPVPGFPSILDRRNQYLTVEYQRTFSPTLFNEARFGYSRTAQLLAPSGTAPISISLLPGERPLGVIALNDVSPLGNSSILPLGAKSNVFQYIDNVSYTKGRHSFKAGFNIRRIWISDFFDVNSNGNFFAGSLQNLLQGRSIFFLGATPGSESRRDWRMTQYGFFGQDDFKVHPRFTLNLGLRYEFTTVPTEVAGRVTNLRNVETDSAITVGDPLFKNPSLRNWAPRVGFAWDLTGDGKTVLRSGFGVFHDFIFGNIFGNTRFQPPFFELLFLPGAPFPNPLAEPVPLQVSPQTIEFDLRNPYVMHYNLNIQRELDPNTVLTIGYNASRGVKLFRVFEANTAFPEFLPDGSKFFPQGVTRRNPAFGPIRQRATDARSWFDSLQVGLNRRFSDGLQFQVSYTLGKFIDDSAGPFQTDQLSQPSNTMDPENRGLDKGLSPFDARHNFVVNWTYEVPLMHNRNDLLGHVLGDWQFNGILTLASGRPFTPVVGFNRSNNLQSGTGVSDRPNLKPGADIGDAKTGDPAQYFDPNIFELQPAGTFGNAGRNIIGGPDFQNLDLSLFKTFRIDEAFRLQFRAEFFNILNRPNFQVPSNVGTVAGTVAGGDIIFNDASGVPVGNAGRIFSTVNTSRQIQFGLKLLF